ncbi:phosphatidyl-N-methylethanolamine N-methyltransferase [Monosporozyma servazzii]
MDLKEARTEAFLKQQGETVYILDHILSTIDIRDKYFQYSVAFIIFNPIFWNVVARLEYNTHFITKLAGSAKTGCYLLAATIFSLGVGRDLIFDQALKHQEACKYLTNDYVKYISYGIFGVGQLLVITSMYQLGITGTYLGDYFGILMKERVTGFPFNVSNNPMYQGSTLCFLATSLYYGKPTGLIITAVVYIMYTIALRFEEPFTAKIYAKNTVEEKRKLK